MLTYWDTSALLHYFTTQGISEINGVTRSHSLTELYSALTGRGYLIRLKDGTSRHRKLFMEAAVNVIARVRAQVQLVDLTPEEIFSVIQRAPKVYAQGARIHDLMHAAAAEKAKADELWTLDQNDFAGLGTVKVL